ncbi:alanine--tRNA ligase-related protein, partial [Xenorhabdus bovienii]|uniref:alanine--tRNA ligase-related protein n=1 Tax=Xenorhabdus bovienii TaxID=40576 RepID=UPI0023B27044
SDFCGYEHNSQQAVVIAIFRNGESVEQIHAGEEAIVILDKTAFYAESGGQIGDTGNLLNGNGVFEVLDTQKYAQAIGHVGKLISGTLSVH